MEGKIRFIRNLRAVVCTADMENREIDDEGKAAKSDQAAGGGRFWIDARQGFSTKGEGRSLGAAMPTKVSETPVKLGSGMAADAGLMECGLTPWS
jgi:hypothetical protein